MARIANSVVRAMDAGIGAPVVIQFRKTTLPPGPIASAQRAAELLGIRGLGLKVRSIRSFNMVNLFLPADLADRVAKNPLVDAVYLDKQNRIPEIPFGGSVVDYVQAMATPVGRVFPLLGGVGQRFGNGFHNGQLPSMRRGVGVTTPKVLGQLGVPKARELGIAGAASRIAIVDSDGSRRLLQHPQFAGKNVERRNVNVSEVSDANGHGSHIGSTAAGLPWTTPDGLYLEGVAPDAPLLMVKSLFTPVGVGSDSDIIRGIEEAIGWARGRPLVINMSLGSSPDQPEAEDALCVALNQIPHETAILCAAAGNDAGPVNSPARCANVLAVAAVNIQGKPASFTSRGPEIDVSMPGVDITSGVEEATLMEAVGKAGFRVSTLSGTSMSTPFATGMVALMMEYFQAKFKARITVETVRAMMREFGEPFTEDTGFGPLSWDVIAEYAAAVDSDKTKLVV